MEILSIAPQGLQQAQQGVEKAAQRIAGVGVQARAEDTVSLSDQMVSLLTARNQFEASLGVAHVADEMQKKTLELLA